MKDKTPTIQEAAEQFLEMISISRSENTARSYTNALNSFCEMLDENDIKINEISVRDIDESLIADFLNYLKSYSPATEQMYTIAVSRFYQYLIAEDLASINLQKLQLLIRSRSRKPGKRLPQFPKDEIREVLDYTQEFINSKFDDSKDQLIAYRDSALIITLADTGLRVHEACNLRRGDIDWNEYKAIIIGKGNQEALVRFSSRSIHAIKSYINLRSELDGASGKPLHALPIFSRHDRGAGKRIIPITTTTARKIIKKRVSEVLGEESARAITPHTFRHYFVTNVLQGSGGNLKLAQELARHKNIQVTQRYAHLSNDELDQGYYEIFEN